MADAWHLPLELVWSEQRQCVLRDGRGHGGKTGDRRATTGEKWRLHVSASSLQ